jgi:hypothetical protein
MAMADTVHQAVDGKTAGAAHETPSEVDRPLRAYGFLVAAFISACSGFAVWLRSSGRQAPERVPVGDLLLLAVATHKASRLVTKDRVTAVVRAPFTRHQGKGGPGEVDEEPRGRGIRRAIGELLTCPYCVGMWIATAATGGLIVAPRFTRWTSATLTALTISDFLQIAYKKAEDSL